MTTGEIWQIIIGIISTIATLTLSLIIYARQVKSEKLVKTQDIDNKTTSFIIENKDEIGLLPLCIISNAIHKTDKHSRRIYTAYNKMDRSVQRSILKHEEINNKLNVTEEIINSTIESFVNIETKYNMGRSILYDNAKYLHRAYEYYKEEIINDIDPHIFKNPYPTFFPEINNSLHGFIDNYLLHEINPNDDAIVKIKKEYFIPPMDLLYTGLDLGNCDEKNVCFWNMRYIISTCYVLCNRELVNGISDDIMPTFEEFELKTYEDMYYYTIYMLIKTFSSIE